MNLGEIEGDKGAVEQRSAHPGQITVRSLPVQEACHLRSQAELCLGIALQMSDRGDAERLRARAAEYLARAVALENQSPALDGGATGQGKA